jgi:hypothetical protein
MLKSSFALAKDIICFFFAKERENQLQKSLSNQKQIIGKNV